MRLVTKTALAAKYDVCERTIENWLAKGLDLGRVKIGGKTLFDIEKADAALMPPAKTTEAA